VFVSGAGGVVERNDGAVLKAGAFAEGRRGWEILAEASRRVETKSFVQLADTSATRAHSNRRRKDNLCIIVVVASAAWSRYP
jgi:hypothetical protein